MHVIRVFLIWHIVWVPTRSAIWFVNLSRMSWDRIVSPKSSKYRIAAKGTVPPIANIVLVSCNNSLSTHFHTPSSPFSTSEQLSRGNVVCRTTDFILCVLGMGCPLCQNWDKCLHLLKGTVINFKVGHFIYKWRHLSQFWHNKEHLIVLSKLKLCVLCPSTPINMTLIH